MSYGKVISGGAQMSKGVSKSINSKLEGFSGENKRRATIASAVNNAFKQKNLSDNTTNNVNGGKFQKVSVPSKV